MAIYLGGAGDREVSSIDGAEEGKSEVGDVPAYDCRNAACDLPCATHPHFQRAHEQTVKRE